MASHWSGLADELGAAPCRVMCVVGEGPVFRHGAHAEAHGNAWCMLFRVSPRDQGMCVANVEAASRIRISLAPSGAGGGYARRFGCSCRALVPVAWPFVVWGCCPSYVAVHEWCSDRLCWQAPCSGVELLHRGPLQL